MPYIKDDPAVIESLPRYKNNALLKAADAVLPLTQNQLTELAKIFSDPIYFIENYCRIVSIDDGYIPFKLYPFQKDLIESLHHNRKTVTLAPRQVGKTSTNAAYILWYILVNEVKTVAVLAHKASGAREVLDRVKQMYEGLPLWLQQGVKTWNKGSIELGNGCKVIAAATTSSAIRGLSISCVTGDAMVTYIDDQERIFHTTIMKANSSNNYLHINEDNMTDKKFYIVYRTTNIVNNKEYIGFHSTNDLDDGYIGSGKLLRRAIEKYGPESFTREIIEIFDNKDSAALLERQLVNREYVERDDTYNLSIGGNVAILYGEANGFYGKTHSEETKSKLRAAALTSYDKTISANIIFECTETGNLLYGIKDVSEKFYGKIKVSRSLLGQLLVEGKIKCQDDDATKRYIDAYYSKLEGKKKLAEQAKRRFTGVKLSDERRENQSKNIKKWIEENPEEHKAKMDKINKNPEKIRKTAEKHLGMKRSDEAKRKMSDAKRGRLAPNKGSKQYYNPTTGESLQTFPGEEIPNGFIPGTGKKKPNRGICHNNGQVNKFFKTGEVVPAEWKIGRLKKCKS